MRSAWARLDDAGMESYPILWSEFDGEVEAGTLELGDTGILLENAAYVHRVFYEDIEAVHISRGFPEQLRGKPTVVVDLAVGRPLRLCSANGPGALTALVERLEHLTATRLPL
jgi:hypothetical protein